jgi:hypothetical protein
MAVVRPNGRGVAVAVLAAVLVVAPASGGAMAARAGTTASSSTLASTSATSAPLRSATLSALRGFLRAWQHRGLSQAGARYLEPGYRVPPGQGAPRLVSGRILSSHVVSRSSPGTLTMEVLLDLRFRGDPGAWGQGRNDRFVTAHRSGPTGRVLLTLATSP